MTNGDQRADEVRALVDQQIKGWAAGDPAAYASVSVPSAAKRSDSQQTMILGCRLLVVLCGSSSVACAGVAKRVRPAGGRDDVRVSNS
jgi:hypothetical protein